MSEPATEAPTGYVDRALYPPLSPSQTGLRGRCPRCGEGRLFKGFLALQPSCSNCGLDYTFIDSGDGPAVFVILIVGFIVAFLALYVEFSFQPPFWVHILLWVPLILILSFGMLRPLKGLMIAIQYRTKAEQGRLQ
ncbi:DUF983 domain-containing protein [Kaistia geumhonensis]|uniref:Uncharacterized protein (DUF983 family) n=1 Tax=Kaistia geumhonensis TaxID=410839 RepID=A0ABU0MB99_9HYPH|nr:DUF983 domain-containing protein [Kaistia geumhonensis]MCX5481186.1 DUF983 domain-containing protein [Kaistia geumhonensis]MDQ0518247.1 uncharacterized protein (DUF983 family) [Kaistia geumhonensis]